MGVHSFTRSATLLQEPHGTPAPPPDERERLAELLDFDILDTPPEAAFDDLTKLAAFICGAPIALVSLVDADRQWFKSRVGLAAPETPRALAFCAHAIRHHDVLEVPDATADQRFRDNPLVVGAPDIRFYAGAPLVTSSGQAMGTLCVIDRTARQLTPEQREALVQLARQVVAQMDVRRANRRLRAAGIFQKTILDSAAVGIIATTPDGVISMFNRKAEQITGFRVAELVGTLTPAVFHDAEEAARRAAELSRALGRTIDPGFEMLAAMPRGDDCAAQEWTYVRRDGARVPVLLSTSALRDTDDSITGYLFVVHDITERKQAEDDLRRSNADLEQFAYVASHDLQEPLRMVASYTELLAQRYRGALDDKADKYIHYAVDGAKRMQELIVDLLAFARVGSQGTPLAPVATRAVLDRVLDSLQVVLRDSRATVDVGALPIVQADAGQLGQLFQNLVANALKFRSDADPHVRIEATRHDGAWRFAVSDNGIGIDMKHADRVFQMFQRLHGRGTYEGSGIGLSIAKRILERHGGRIWFESRPGEGTTFFFTLQPAATAGRE